VPQTRHVGPRRARAVDIEHDRVLAAALRSDAMRPVKMSLALPPPGVSPGGSCGLRRRPIRRPDSGGHGGLQVVPLRNGLFVGRCE
jgi:hypothetical protein